MNNEINQVLEEEGAIVWKSIIGLLILPLVTLVVQFLGSHILWVLQKQTICVY